MTEEQRKANALMLGVIEKMFKDLESHYDAIGKAYDSESVPLSVIKDSHKIYYNKLKEGLAIDKTK